VGDVCSSCGYLNPLGARFCSSCGVQQQIEPVGDHPTATHDALMSGIDASEGDPFSLEEFPPGISAMFVVRDGPKRGSRIHLDSDSVSVGRHPQSDIFLDDVTVSRRHAEVVRSGTHFEVVDSGSLNGTYVNQDRVDRQMLASGDIVQVGKFKLVYVTVDEEPS